MTAAHLRCPLSSDAMVRYTRLPLNIQVYQALNKPLYLMPPAIHHGTIKANNNQLGNYCHWFVATG